MIGKRVPTLTQPGPYPQGTIYFSSCLFVMSTLCLCIKKTFLPSSFLFGLYGHQYSYFNINSRASSFINIILNTLLFVFQLDNSIIASVTLYPTRLFSCMLTLMNLLLTSNKFLKSKGCVLFISLNN